MCSRNSRSESTCVDDTWQHTTVLLNQAVQALDIAPDQTYVDGTFGRGGHSRLILSALSAQGRLIAFDKDPQAVQAAQALQDPRLDIRHQGFSAMAELAPASVAGILLDLGVSSPQIDNPERGFSFRHDGRLDMRMDPTRGASVRQWLEQADQAQIAEVIREYGEERFAAQIAKAIVARRQERGVPAGTAELAQLVAGAVKTREPGQDPATRTFQAFRIFINAQPGGRLAVISFHSLEDRIVKQFIARHSREEVDRRAPWAAGRPLLLQALGRIRPDADEVARNPRSRSAILRVARRTGEPA
ncbi:MAG: hypothetical protein RLZZ123_772 [Pseudomonadota bacterium]